jgi:hypothetical protein
LRGRNAIHLNSGMADCHLADVEILLLHGIHSYATHPGASLQLSVRPASQRPRPARSIPGLTHSCRPRRVSMTAELPTDGPHDGGRYSSQARLQESRTGGEDATTAMNQDRPLNVPREEGSASR